MNKKRIGLIGIIFLVLFIGTLIILRNQLDTTPYIAVPSDGLYEEVWTQCIEEIKEELQIPEIKIVTYDSEKELENLLSRKSKTNMLFAEIPISSKFDYIKWFDKGLIQDISYNEIPRREKMLFPFVNVAQNKQKEVLSSIPMIRTSFDYEKNLYFLPFSFDPWNVYRLQQKDKESLQKTEYILALAGKEEMDAIGVYGLTVALINNSSLVNVSSTLKNLQIINFIQHNAHTYSQHDAEQIFFNKETSYLYLKYSELSNLSILDASNLQLAYLPNNITFEDSSIYKFSTISTLTGLIFPNKTNEDKLGIVYKDLIHIFANPNFQYKINTKRNVLSIWTDVDFVDRTAQTITYLANGSSKCILPEFVITPKDNQKRYFIQQIHESLTTKFIEDIN